MKYINLSLFICANADDTVSVNPQELSFRPGELEYQLTMSDPLENDGRYT